jgi:hypothetical protein
MRMAARKAIFVGSDAEVQNCEREEHEQNPVSLNVHDALSQHKRRKPDPGLGVEGRKDSGHIEMTTVGGEHVQDVAEGIQYPGEHQQMSDGPSGQESTAPQSQQDEQHTDRAQARWGQRSEDGGGMHAADKNEEAPFTSAGKQGQPDPLW